MTRQKQGRCAGNDAVSPAIYAVLIDAECANAENSWRAKIIDVGSKNIALDNRAIIVHILEEPGMVVSQNCGFPVWFSLKSR